MSETVAQVLKRIREDRKLSKSRLSREAGVSDAYIVQIEKGDRSPSEEVLRRLAHVLRVPPHHLLVPGGVYDAETIANVEERVARWMVAFPDDDQGEASEFRERMLDREYQTVDYYRRMNPSDLELLNKAKSQTEFDLPADIYWGWNQPLAAMPPENWDKLADSDRRMVQKLINRLTRAEDTEV